MAIQFNPFVAPQEYNDKKKKSDDYLYQAENLGDYVESDYVSQLKQNGLYYDNAIKNYGNFSYADDGLMNDIRTNYGNRKFSYDINGDALYQQYKDQYMRQGSLAMMDTMGQASAMTGGYGNSYAQSVGQQAYQGYLQQLNDKIPELYQLALSKYNQEGQDMLNYYSLLADDRQTKYNDWNNEYSKLVDNRNYYTDEYHTTRGEEYGEHIDNFNKYTGLSELYGAAADSIYNKAYTDYTTDIANQKWGAEYDLSDNTSKLNDQISSLSASNAELQKIRDNLVVDENGNPIGWKDDFNADGTRKDGTTTSGSTSNGQAYAQTKVEGFEVKEGKNFDVVIDNTKFTVENKGKVTDTDTLNKLKKLNAQDGQVIVCDNETYIKQGGLYYQFGATGWWTEGHYNNLLKTLQG